MNYIFLPYTSCNVPLCVCGSFNKWLLNMLRYVLQNLRHILCHDIDEVQTKFVLCLLHQVSYRYCTEIVF